MKTDRFDKLHGKIPIIMVLIVVIVFGVFAFYGWLTHNEVRILYDQTRSMVEVMDDQTALTICMKKAQEQYAIYSEEGDVEVWRLIAGTGMSMQESPIKAFLECNDASRLPAQTSGAEETSDYIEVLRELASKLKVSGSRRKTLVIIGDLLNYSSPDPWKPDSEEPPKPGADEEQRFKGIDIVVLHPPSYKYKYAVIEPRWRKYFVDRGADKNTIRVQAW